MRLHLCVLDSCIRFVDQLFELSFDMAKSKYEYVKKFESDDSLLPNCWIVIRLDGRGFHKFTDSHNFKKPNDERGIQLLCVAASHVMEQIRDVVVGYGQSDEFSFVISKTSTIYSRRESKIVTALCSLLTSSYVFNWSSFFPDEPLKYPPSFDGRAILYPSTKNIRDYLSWRQADCHINNLYNTCFWSLVQSGDHSNAQSEDLLRGTVSSEKNELLHSRFSINYNNEAAVFRKGTTLLWVNHDTQTEKICSDGVSRVVTKKCPKLVSYHSDIIQDQFWSDHPHIFGPI